MNFCSLSAESYLDYPLSYITDSCQIMKKRLSPENEPKEKIIDGRKKYRNCMNFILSLSTTLNKRCMLVKKKLISSEDAMTYADLSNVTSTNELIDEIMSYSKKYPHFINQIAWLHASKALSQKWPCK
tara:strand:+ start:143 stop:526 length:384 start_codon:yes stop_codon:yes gene_type:complete